VRVRLNHLVQPLLNQEMVFADSAVTRTPISVGYVFLPTVRIINSLPLTAGGTLQTANMACFWPA
jgi:hypothetical protein